MISFVTEFPVVDVTTGDFVAQVIAWLRGADYSTVLDQYSLGDLTGESAHLRADSGEELHFRQILEGTTTKSIGFRHDFPDGIGRLWRTESVLSDRPKSGQSALVRVRTQCLARQQGAILEIPRKPYLVKAMLQDNWGATDGALEVTDKPTWLTDDDYGLLVASESVVGKATRSLPIVYISALGSARWTLSRIEIEKLAYELGGVAHVLVEPSRTFAFGLRDQVSGKNAYGGSIAIALPGRGIVRKFHFGWLFEDSADLVSAIRSAAIEYGSYIPAQGWDWTELQEQALRIQRERDRGSTTREETERLYEEEIVSLQQRIRELEEQLITRPVAPGTADDDSFPVEEIQKRVGPEIYRGEFLDRLHLAARVAINAADQIGLDERTKFVLSEVNSKIPWSPELSNLEDALRRATKDPRRSATEIVALLTRHGYHKKSDNKHIRLEANDDIGGLDAITLPKTPSDIRGLTNQRLQIERTLGLVSMRKL